jgi:hypothetical protein
LRRQFYFSAFSALSAVNEKPDAIFNQTCLPFFAGNGIDRDEISAVFSNECRKHGRRMHGRREGRNAPLAVVRERLELRGRKGLSRVSVA